MYFSRFHRNILKEALYKKRITTHEYSAIESFWYDNILYDISEIDEAYLKSIGIKCESFETNKKIIYYPHLKSMCLKVCKKNPRKWLYEDELDGNFLFGYIISVEGCRLVTDKGELE